MMKVIHINTTSGIGSTGVIAQNICTELEAQGGEGKIIYGYGNAKFKKSVCTQSKIGYYLNNLISRICGIEGITNYFTTKKIIRFLKKENPQVIHLHNLHGHYLHIGLLFKYIKRYDIPVVWTLHDCWAFTGGCAYFDAVKCEKWKSKCEKCPQGNTYPKWIIDNTSFMWNYKKRCLQGVKNMSIVTPSEWLAMLVKQSYLKEYPIQTINNGINIDIFNMREGNEGVGNME